jgi:hypothetical protein
VRPERCICICVYVIDTRYKIKHMPEKENTLYEAKKTSQRMPYAIYVNKVKSPDLFHPYGNIDKKTTCLLCNSMTMTYWHMGI